MIRLRAATTATLVILTACTVAPRPSATPALAPVSCAPASAMPLEGRASPLDSTIFQLGQAEARVCYGRPSARGRVVFGELVPYDTLWRTGANEPTRLHLPVATEVAGFQLEPGSYSFYTVPGRESWDLVFNRSIDQWGHESQYAAVRHLEVGRTTVPAETTESPVETFTIRPVPPTGATAALVLEWERTRIVVPVTPAH